MRNTGPFYLQHANVALTLSSTGASNTIRDLQGPILTTAAIGTGAGGGGGLSLPVFFTQLLVNSEQTVGIIDPHRL